MISKLQKALENFKTKDEYWIETAKIEFAAKLESHLEYSGLSKKEFAEKLNTSPAWVTKVFRGDANFTLETMVRLVRALGARLHLHVANEDAQVAWLAVVSSRPRRVRPSSMASWADVREEIALRIDPAAGRRINVARRNSNERPSAA